MRVVTAATVDCPRVWPMAAAVDATASRGGGVGCGGGSDGPWLLRRLW